MDTDELVHALISRRELLKAIADSLPDEKDPSIEDLKNIAETIESERNFIQKIFAKIFGGVPAKYHQLVKLNTRIMELSQTPHVASSVFITFETEKAQRLVLEKMTVSRWDARRQNKNAVSNPNYLFDGSYVCLVEEPGEPSTIRWQDLHESVLENASKLITTGIVLGLLIGFYFLIDIVREEYPTYFALVISISNSIFPTLAKALSKLEKHVNEERRQLWLYIKIVIFRCVNTVLLVFIITPYTSTIMNGEENLLYGVYAIFFAEIFTSTILQFFDLGGNFKRHYTAPRAKTQEAVNLAMTGTEVNIAERYTNMTKIAFLALWYCSLYPAVLFMCSAALFVNFYGDKFSLMRTWKPSSKVGQSMSRLNRSVIFPIMLIIMTWIASRNWENFTFDNLCEVNSLDPGSSNTGNVTYELKGIDGIINNSTVVVSSNSLRYKFCESNSESKTDEQSRVASIYGTFFIYTSGFIGFVLVLVICRSIQNYFFTRYSPVGEKKVEKFSSVASTNAYIPQVQSEKFAFPFLICPVETLIDSGFLHLWNDPFHDVSYYDITKDARQLLADNDKEFKASTPVFSSMIHFPPPASTDE